jgi:hypothetical protein
MYMTTDKVLTCVDCRQPIASSASHAAVRPAVRSARRRAEGLATAPTPATATRAAVTIALPGRCSARRARGAVARRRSRSAQVARNRSTAATASPLTGAATDATSRTDGARRSRRAPRLRGRADRSPTTTAWDVGRRTDDRQVAAEARRRATRMVTTKAAGRSRSRHRRSSVSLSTWPNGAGRPSRPAGRARRIRAGGERMPRDRWQPA